jgi:hypothetical protein
VKKRNTAKPLALNNSKGSNYCNTEFFNARLNLPEVERALLDVNVGEFLAGDKGARITISKFLVCHYDCSIVHNLLCV